MILFLIGYMGSGKSTVGRGLARVLGFRFVDMDVEIENLCGMSVTEIFATQGESRFRDMERELLCSFVGQQNLVVSTGGGVPCSQDNMEVMNGTGITIYLKMSPRGLVQRLAHGRDKRPIIKDMDDRQLLEFIESNLVVRGPFYEQASMVIDCDGVGDQYILEHIEQAVGRVKVI